MRISDWSSDVCSSDLLVNMVRALERAIAKPRIIIHEQIRGMAYPDIARRDHFIVAQHMRAPRLAHQENPPDNALDVDVGCALQPASIRFWDGMTRYIARPRRSTPPGEPAVHRTTAQTRRRAGRQ